MVTIKSNTPDSSELAKAISAADFGDCAVTVVGYGYMGKEYVKALRALGVGEIRVYSRSAEPLVELRDVDGVETIAGGIEKMECPAKNGELGIITTPSALLVSATRKLATLGFERLLIEKPVSLLAGEIRQLANEMEQRGVESFCAFNRTAFPSCYEVGARVEREGGITSCNYEFTEMIKPDWSERFPEEELTRWGIANSAHVISMAHGLIGLPENWQSFRSGAKPVSWHSSGSVFVGAGISERNIPFSYHADWGSTGRWAVEIHTRESSYRLCPLETVQCRTESLGDWGEIPLVIYSSGIKPGILEQVAVLTGKLRVPLPGWRLADCARLTSFAEDIFGYTA
jgi:predicted dehydrogenase